MHRDHWNPGRSPHPPVAVFLVGFLLRLSWTASEITHEEIHFFSYSGSSDQVGKLRFIKLDCFVTIPCGVHYYAPPSYRRWRRSLRSFQRCTLVVLSDNYKLSITQEDSNVKPSTSASEQRACPSALSAFSQLTGGCSPIHSRKSLL